MVKGFCSCVNRVNFDFFSFNNYTATTYDKVIGLVMYEYGFESPL